MDEQLLRRERRFVVVARRRPGRIKLVDASRLQEAQANLVQSRGHRNGAGSSGCPMNTAVVDDDVAINLDGRAIVGPRGERVLAIAIDPKPTAPFDAELLLRQRRRIRGHEVEIDLSLDAHNSRLVSPVRVGVERRRHPPLRPHPQDWHEEDQHEENTCHAPHVRAQALRQVRGNTNRSCMRLACFTSRSAHVVGRQIIRAPARAALTSPPVLLGGSPAPRPSSPR